MLQKGVTAPDFVLKDQDGHEFRLSDLTGKRVPVSYTHLTLPTSDLV